MDRVGDNTGARGRKRSVPLQQGWAGADSGPHGSAAFIRPKSQTRVSAAGAGCVCDGLSPQTPFEPGPGRDAPALGGSVSDSECDVRSPAPAALAVQREMGEQPRPLLAQRREGAGLLPVIRGYGVSALHGLKRDRRSKREHSATSAAAKSGGSRESPQARHGVAPDGSAPPSDAMLGSHGLAGLPVRTGRKAGEASRLALNAGPRLLAVAGRRRPGTGLLRGLGPR